MGYLPSTFYLVTHEVFKWSAVFTSKRKMYDVLTSLPWPAAPKHWTSYRSISEICRMNDSWYTATGQGNLRIQKITPNELPSPESKNIDS